MAWLDEGTPWHECALPEMSRWSTEDPRQGFWTRHTDSEERGLNVHSGARWQCDDEECGLVWRLTEKGEWEREGDHGSE